MAGRKPLRGALLTGYWGYTKVKGGKGKIGEHVP